MHPSFLFIYSLAPELYKILLEEEMDPKEKHEMLVKSDVFALGVLISEILTGMIETKVYKDNETEELAPDMVGDYD